jgi:hypothetical protein
MRMVGSWGVRRTRFSFVYIGLGDRGVWSLHITVFWNWEYICAAQGLKSTCFEGSEYR